MTTSIVIPAYNGWNFLKQNLPRVLKLGADEVIIVDDASTDNTPVRLLQNFPEIKLVTHPKNTRFPEAVNDGFRTARGEVIILLNQDVSPSGELLKSILPHFSSLEIFAVTFNEQGRSWARGEFKRGFIEYQNGALDHKVHPSLWASGGSSAIRKSYWDQLGGFYTGFNPGYFEDFDLGLRAWKRGYRIVWEPKAQVDHTPETSYGRVFANRYLTRIKERNFLLAQWRNLDSANLQTNLRAVGLRCLTHPGYLIPASQAMAKYLSVLAFRKKELKYRCKTDAEVFAVFK